VFNGKLFTRSWRQVEKGDERNKQCKLCSGRSGNRLANLKQVIAIRLLELEAN